MKRADLTPTVGKQFVRPDGTLNDLIDIFRRLVFSVDLFVFPVGELGSDEAGMTRQQAELIGCRADSRGDRGADNRWSERLDLHLPSPVQRMGNAYAGRSRLDISLDILRGCTYVVLRRSSPVLRGRPDRLP